MPSMTQMWHAESKIGNNEHEDDLAAQLAVASRQLTAIRVQERAAANTVKALIERRKNLARSRLEEAMRYAEQVEIACARACVELEMDQERINCVTVKENDKDRLNRVEYDARIEWNKHLEQLVFRQRSEITEQTSRGVNWTTRLPEVAKPPEPGRYNPPVITETEKRGETNPYTTAGQADFRRKEEKWLCTDDNARVFVADGEERLEEYSNALRADGARRFMPETVPSKEEEGPPRPGTPSVDDEGDPRESRRFSDVQTIATLVEPSETDSEESSTEFTHDHHARQEEIFRMAVDEAQRREAAEEEEYHLVQEGVRASPDDVSSREVPYVDWTTLLDRYIYLPPWDYLDSN